MDAEKEFEKWFNRADVKFAHQRLYRVDALAAFEAGRRAGLEEAVEIMEKSDQAWPTYEETFDDALNIIRQKIREGEWSPI